MVQQVTPLRSPGVEKDGQEFGLVPRYVLRKKKAVNKEGRGPTGDSNHVKNNQNGHHDMMKDCDEEDTPQKTPQEVDKLLHETNSLLARRWRLSSLIDSERDKKVLLATEAYLPSKAADRIEKNCKTKMELFGSELMDKKITLFEDLSSEKSEVGVEGGYVQLLPTRDLAGRAVLFFQYDQDLYSEQPINFRKILFYMMASALEDVDTARKGISMVVWNGAPTKWFDPFWRVFEKISAPFKISKLHYCQVSQYESSYQVLEKRERGETDVRIHKGSLQECMHGLVTYGVPSHFIPLNPLDGSINLKEHLKWIELRRRIESFPESQQACIVLVPGQDDVLLGKRKMSMNGNVLYHQMIMKNIKAYHEATSEDARDDILMAVWDSIQCRGGRFLLQVEDGQLWERLELQSALYKISQAFDFLCMQLYAPKPTSSKDSSSKNSKDDEDIFFGWNDLLDGKKCYECFDLIHCKGDGFGKPAACW
ncbi:unnamed protein product [Pseudo-nitzschia multistriata]|uniref:DUF6824 domain-containing protein n=1 Tax=Pseudo-nitzschia multistriata TaxID=183589 RepID=A0A448Z887_9STRA|nr:unnamed protein product [Pseudo-nitzschia multistriata]